MSEDGLRRMEERASKAENLITNLKTQIDSFKKSSLEHSIEEEERRLKNENDHLRQEVEHYKQKLIELERINGITPIFISSANKKEKIIFKEVLPPIVGSVNGNDAEKCVEKKKTKEKQHVKKVEPLNKVPPVDELVDVSRLDFRIGRITSVKKHPDADSLYVEEVDLAETQPRVVVSGLVNHVPMEEMHNRLVVLLCNLKPAKMRGVTSEAMVMCASSPEKVEILIPPANSKPGDRIVFEGYPGNPDEQLNPKKKIFEQIQPDLRTSDDKVATYKGVPFTVPGKGIVVAPTMTLSAIK